MKKAILFLLLSLTSVPIFADLITLNNGDTVKGKILSQTRNLITLKTPYGNLTWKKTKIKKIIYEQKQGKKAIANVYTKQLLLYRGELIKQGIEKLSLKTMDGKTIELNISEIDRINWKKKAQLKFISGEDMRMPSLWRSTLLPSWGQFHQQRKTAGYAIAISSGCLALSTLITRLSYNDVKGDYQAIDYDDRELRQKVENWRIAYNISITGLGLVYIYNIVDALIFSPRQQIIQYKKAGLQPEFNAVYRGISYLIRF